MKLVERDAEAAVLEDLFRACLDGQGTVAVISGGLGSGKTALLKMFEERLNQRAVGHFRATASPSEQSLPMGLIDQLLRSRELAAPHQSRLPWILAHGAMAAGPLVDSLDCDVQLSAPMLGWLWEALSDMAASGPLVITVDDAHFADPPSLRCLIHLIHRLQSIPAMVLMSECSHAPSMRRLFHSEILGLPNCRHLRLKPLSEAGVSTLVAEQVGTQAGRCLSRSYHEATGGNPLLLRGLLADGQDHSAGQGRITLGEAFERSVLTLMYRAEPTLVDVAGALAVLDGAMSVESLSALLNMETTSIVEALAILTDAGLLDSGAFRRDEARQAILNGLRPGQRAEVHRRVAGLLYSEGAAVPLVARHLVAGGSPVVPWGVCALRDAARQALTEGDLVTAVGQLRLAYRGCNDAQETGRIAAELVAAEWRIDPSSVAMDLATLTAANGRGYLDPEQTLTLAGHLAWHGRTTQAVDVLEGLGAVADDGDGLLPTGETALLYLRGFIPGVSPAAPAQGQSQTRQVQPYSRRNGRTAGSPADPMAGRIAPHRAMFGLDAALRFGAGPEILSDAEQTLQRIDLDDATVIPICCALITLVHGDQHDVAAYWCDSFLKAAQAANAPMWRSLFAAVRSAIYLCRGDLLNAEKYIEEAFDLIPPPSWGTAVGAPLTIMVRTATALGAYDKAAAYANLPVPDAMFLNLSGPHFLSARGHLLLATDQPDAALHQFTRCGEVMGQWGIDQPTVVPWRTDAAQACLRLGDLARARQLAADQLARLQPGPSRVRAITLRVLAGATASDGRESLLRDAAEVSGICGDQLNLAYALADLGAVLNAADQSDEARPAMEQAIRLAEECGAAPLVESLRRHVGKAETPGARVGGGTVADRSRADVLTGLSAAERRVATLAARGCTNDQIARRLYITVSTVEQHLTRVYRKLKISRRGELPPDLRRRPGT